MERRSNPLSCYLINEMNRQDLRVTGKQMTAQREILEESSVCRRLWDAVLIVAAVAVSLASAACAMQGSSGVNSSDPARDPQVRGLAEVGQGPGNEAAQLDDKPACPEMFPLPQPTINLALWENCREVFMSDCGGTAECSCASGERLVATRCDQGFMRQCVAFPDAPDVEHSCRASGRKQ